MGRQFSVEAATCTQHEKLEAECQKALKTWNEHRAESARSRLGEKKADQRFLQLQAKYARAYTMLQNHLHNCMVCMLASVEERYSEKNSDTRSGKELHI
jgi:hypothetical protein